MINTDLLDHQFKQLFLDPDQVGFKVDDHIYIKMFRKVPLTSSYIEVYKDGKFWFKERLGRFNTYNGFFNAMKGILK